MNVLRLLIPIFAAAGVALTPALVRADVVAVVVTGGGRPATRALASAAVGAELIAEGHTVSKVEVSAKELDAATACVQVDRPWTCLKPSVQGKGIHGLVVLNLSAARGADGSTTTELTEQMFAESIDGVFSDKRYCAHCTDDQLGRLSTDVTRSVLHNTAVMAGRTVVSVTSTPRGARLTFDGQVQGVTDSSITTWPGAHTIGLELDGFQSETRNVDASDGKTSEIAISLRPVGAGPAPVPTGPVATAVPRTSGVHDVAPVPGHRSHVLPGLMIGVGAVAIVGGGVALAFNQSAPNGDATKSQSARYYTTTGPGIGLIAGGAVVAGIGGYLWWRVSHSNAAPTVAPVAGGAVVGLSRTF